MKHLDLFIIKTPRFKMLFRSIDLFQPKDLLNKKLF